MLSFVSDELVWAIGRDRAAEARKVRPRNESHAGKDDQNRQPPAARQTRPRLHSTPACR
jgi:hypothetical protein